MTDSAAAGSKHDPIEAALDAMEDFFHNYRRERIIIKTKRQFLAIYNTDGRLLGFDEARQARINETSAQLDAAIERRACIRGDIIEACERLCELAREYLVEIPNTTAGL